ncbi:MAG: SUMF1/EgtB/PvdO family nonheme iron enzyme [Chloroflexi bacterium]|nr:SUMF1/EgtB/PvdO family nonheme iron enzyme [Chloroflexota bacterium]
MVVYDSKRRPVEFGRQIGQGGESAVYHVADHPNYLIKRYTTPHIAIYEQKLAWMLSHPPNDPTDQPEHASFAWPIVMLYDEKGVFVGYLMPRVQNAVTALKVFNPRLRIKTLPKFDRRYLHRTALNLAAAVEALHARDYVIGDLHESNIMVTSSALVTLIDTDSFQVETAEAFYPCIVGKPEYTPPELQGKHFQEVRRTPEHDHFGLGVLIFQLLMEGNHPFRGRWLGSGDPPPMEEKIRRGLFPYFMGISGPVAPPPTGLGLDTLHPEVVNLIQHCFADGHQQPSARPTPGEWKQALGTAEDNLTACPQGHYYSNYTDTCPKCRTQAAPRQRRQPVTPPPAPEIVVQPVYRASPIRKPTRVLPKTPMTRRQFLTYLVLLALIGLLLLPCIFALGVRPLTGNTTLFPTTAPLSQLTPQPTDIPVVQGTTDARGVPMVFVSAGPFVLGGIGHLVEPVRMVMLDAFYIDQYEVTNAQFAAFLNEQRTDSIIVTTFPKARSQWVHLYPQNDVWQADESYADHPVVLANWFDAQAYCEWRGGRLPTEAEWEKAARGTNGREYPWSNSFSAGLCNTRESEVGGPMPVGSYSPEGDSPYGCADMAGNVQEWVHDWFQEDYYSVSPSSNPPGPDSGTHKVMRGGDWMNGNGQDMARTSTRGSHAIPTYRNIDVGFRCVVPVSE